MVALLATWEVPKLKLARLNLKVRRSRWNGRTRTVNSQIGPGDLFVDGPGGPIRAASRAGFYDCKFWSYCCSGDRGDMPWSLLKFVVVACVEWTNGSLGLAVVP